jgi:paraquat-inducible protein A
MYIPIPVDHLLIDTPTNISAPRLVACHECDLLQRKAKLAPGGVAFCSRCDAQLYRERDHGSLERAVALLCGAAILYIVANFFPILGLEVHGQRTEARLIDTVLQIRADGMPGVASLVFFTTILAPLLEISLLLAILLPLLRGTVPGYLPLVLRFIQTVKPWSMVEVFMLALLVSLVKLAHLATLVPGIALWSFALLIVLMAAASATIDPRDLWQRLERSK